MNLLHPLWPCALLTLLYVALYFPGSLSIDSVQFLQFWESSTYRDNYPLFPCLYLGAINSTFGSPVLFIAINCFVSFYSFFYLINQTSSSINVKVTCIVLFALWPTSMAMFGIAWTDVLLISYFFLYLALSQYLRDNLSRGFFHVALPVIALLSIAIFISGIRHNAISFLFPAILYDVFTLTCFYFKRIRQITAAAISIGASLFISVALLLTTAFAAPKIAKSERAEFWQHTAKFDLAGISIKSNSLQFSDITYPNGTLDDIKALYVPYSSAQLSSGNFYFTQSPNPGQRFNNFTTTNNPAILSELKKQWANSIIKHPISYLEHRIDFAMCLAGLNGNNKYLAPVYDGIVPNTLGITPRPEFSIWITRPLYDLSRTTPLFSLWIYLLLHLFACIFSISMKIGNPHTYTILLACSMSYFTTTSILAFSADFRYIFPCISLSLFSVIHLVLSGYSKKIA